MRPFAILAILPLLLAADWPQHRGPKRDGHSAETGILRTWPRGGPGVVWSRPVGAGWAGPVVQGERLILFHRVGDAEVVECLDAATGKGLWKGEYRTRYVDDFDFDAGPRSTPLIADAKVFTLGADGELRAWELASGKPLWDRNINKDYQVSKGYFGVATSPVLAAGKLLVNVGGKGAGVVAFDPAAGKELWKAAEDQVSYSSPVVASVQGEETAVFFTRSGLLAVAPPTGKVRFTFPWRPRLQASVNAATPIVSGDRVYLSTSYGTGAVVLDLSKDTPREVWSGDDSMSNHYSTPVLVGEHLYGIDGRQEGGRASLRCVEWGTGKVKWTKEGFGCAGLIAVDGLVLAAAEGGDVVAFEATPTAYKELARGTVLDSPVRALPALAGGRLFVRDGKQLVALQVGKK
jgi:outer membrane protein assembly factor BamB